MKKYVILLSSTAIIMFMLLYTNHVLQSKRVPPNNAPQPEDTSQVAASEQTKISTDKIPILMYHSIENGPNSLYVSKRVFENHIKYLIDNNYRFISFEDIYNNNIPNNPIILTFDDGYEDFYLNAYPILAENNIKATVFIIINNIDIEGYLSSEQIAEMNNLISFQSHTLSHSDLTSLDDETLDNELRVSKEKLQEIVKNRVSTISYPSGKYNSKAADLAANYYDFGVTTKNGTFNLDTSKLKIPRIRISNGDNSYYLESKIIKQ